MSTHSFGLRLRLRDGAAPVFGSASAGVGEHLSPQAIRAGVAAGTARQACPARANPPGPLVPMGAGAVLTTRPRASGSLGATTFEQVMSEMIFFQPSFLSLVTCAK